MAKYRPTVNDHDSRIHKVLWSNEDGDGDGDKKINSDTGKALASLHGRAVVLNRFGMDVH